MPVVSVTVTSPREFDMGVVPIAPNRVAVAGTVMFTAPPVRFRGTVVSPVAALAGRAVPRSSAAAAAALRRNSDDLRNGLTPLSEAGAPPAAEPRGVIRGARSESYHPEYLLITISDDRVSLRPSPVSHRPPRRPDSSRPRPRVQARPRPSW